MVATGQNSDSLSSFNTENGTFRIVKSENQSWLPPPGGSDLLTGAQPSRSPFEHLFTPQHDTSIFSEKMFSDNEDPWTCTQLQQLVQPASPNHAPLNINSTNSRENQHFSWSKVPPADPQLSRLKPADQDYPSDIDFLDDLPPADNPASQQEDEGLGIENVSNFSAFSLDSNRQPQGNLAPNVDIYANGGLAGSRIDIPGFEDTRNLFDKLSSPSRDFDVSRDILAPISNDHARKSTAKPDCIDYNGGIMTISHSNEINLARISCIETLRKLTIHNSHIANVSVLLEMHSLVELYISHNEISNVDARHIERLAILI